MAITLRRITQATRDDRGSAVMETAIMIPVMLMLAFGLIMFAAAIKTDIVVETAAREGAKQYAVSNNRESARQVVLRELAVGGKDSGKASIKLVADGWDRTVTVEVPYSIYVPFAGEYRLSLRGRASFNVQR